jgi:hypothetical protein
MKSTYELTLDVTDSHVATKLHESVGARAASSLHRTDFPIILYKLLGTLTVPFLTRNMSGWPDFYHEIAHYHCVGGFEKDGHLKS